MRLIEQQKEPIKSAWTTKRKIIVGIIVFLLLAIIAVLAAVLLKMLVFNEKLVAAPQRRICGDAPCVHGSCRCTGSEKICVCYANYTGKSCDTLRQAVDCVGEECLEEKDRPPTVDNGWFSPGVEYEYLLTKSRRNWFEARRICQEYGGDLANLGIRNRATRISAALQLNRGNITWIGLQREKGKWSWVNGDRPYNVYWLPDQPNKELDRNCAVIDGYDNDYSTENYECDRRFHALCEKRVQY